MNLRVRDVDDAKGLLPKERRLCVSLRQVSEQALGRDCRHYIADVLIPETNKFLQRKMDLHEFYVVLGCIFYMSCFVSIDNRADWWSTSPIDMMSGAPFCLNSYMTRKRFVEIMSALKYTDKEAPTTFIDRFHEVRQMIDAFNEHYESEYSPSCGDKGHFIMWRIRLMEGKDRPKLPNGQFAFPSKWEKKGYNKTVDLLRYLSNGSSNEDSDGDSDGSIEDNDDYSHRDDNDNGDDSDSDESLEDYNSDSNGSFEDDKDYAGDEDDSNEDEGKDISNGW